MKKILFILMAVFALTITTGCSKDGKGGGGNVATAIECMKNVAKAIDDESVSGVVDNMTKLDETIGKMSKAEKKEFAQWFKSKEGRKYERIFDDIDDDFEQKLNRYADKHDLEFDNIEEFDPDDYLSDDDDDDEEYDDDDYENDHGRSNVELGKEIVRDLTDALEKGNAKKFVDTAVRMQELGSKMSPSDERELDAWGETPEGKRLQKRLERAQENLDQSFMLECYNYAQRKGINLDELNMDFGGSDDDDDWDYEEDNDWDYEEAEEAEDDDWDW